MIKTPLGKFKVELDGKPVECSTVVQNGNCVHCQYKFWRKPGDEKMHTFSVYLDSEGFENNEFTSAEGTEYGEYTNGKDLFILAVLDHTDERCFWWQSLLTPEWNGSTPAAEWYIGRFIDHDTFYFSISWGGEDDNHTYDALDIWPPYVYFKKED